MYTTIILDNNEEAKRIDGSLWNLYGILFDRYRNDKYIRVELNKIIVINMQRLWDLQISFPFRRYAELDTY